MIVFVYGSLLTGLGNHRLMEGGDFITDGKVHDVAMYSLGGFPGVVHGVGTITGELWEVSAAQEVALDRLEGHPTFYKREPMTVHTDTGEHTAWMYIYQGDVRGLKHVADGDWRREVSEQ